MYAFIHSTSFIILNLWTEFEKYADYKKYILPGLIVISQLILLLVLKLYFFAKEIEVIADTAMTGK